MRQPSMNVGALVTLVAAVHCFFMREFWVKIHSSPAVYCCIDVIDDPGAMDWQAPEVRACSAWGTAVLPKGIAHWALHGRNDRQYALKMITVCVRCI